MMGMGAYYELHWIVFVIGMSVVIGLGPLATLIVVNYVSAIRSTRVHGANAADVRFFPRFYRSRRQQC